MQPTFNGQKRPLEQDHSTEYQANKRRHLSPVESESATTPSVSDDPRIRDLSMESREGLRFVNATLQVAYPCLDLSHLSPAEVSDIPFDLINPAIQSVHTLILPNGLECLPMFCKQLAKLQRLYIQDFRGENLDLRDLASLNQLNGSAGPKFHELHINVAADIRLHIAGKNTKIKTYRYAGEKLMPHSHALPSHAYYKILPGEQKPDFTNFNGESFFSGTQNAIFCNTISPEILYRKLSPEANDWKRIGYFGITDTTSLTATMTQPRQAILRRRLSEANYYAFVDETKFCQWLSNEFTKILAGAENGSLNALPDGRLVKGMRVFSVNHELHFLMIIKPGPLPEFIAEMYDPNMTRTHIRVVANRLDQITDPKKPWLLSDFMEPDYVAGYMRGSSPPMLCFTGAEQRKDNHSTEVQSWVAESSIANRDIMFLSINMQLENYILPYWQDIVSKFLEKNILLSAGEFKDEVQL